MKRTWSFAAVFISLVASTLAVDSLEYIALKRIEKHKKPRIIQVPIYTVKHNSPPIHLQQPYQHEESRKYPLYVPIAIEQDTVQEHHLSHNEQQQVHAQYEPNEAATYVQQVVPIKQANQPQIRIAHESVPQPQYQVIRIPVPAARKVGTGQLTMTNLQALQNYLARRQTIKTQA